MGSLPAEEFQRRLMKTLEGLDGGVPIFDILVFGVGDTKEEALLDHDVKLGALFGRCPAKGIKLNRDKLSFVYLKSRSWDMCYPNMD